MATQMAFPSTIPTAIPPFVPDMACCAFMLVSLTLVVLQVHVLSYRACIGPKSMCVYVFVLPYLAYACTALFGAATFIFMNKRGTAALLVPSAYALLWTTRTSGPAIRRCLQSLLNMCVFYLACLTFGMVCLALMEDPWSILTISLFGVILLFKKFQKQ